MTTTDELALRLQLIAARRDTDRARRGELEALLQAARSAAALLLVRCEAGLPARVDLFEILETLEPIQRAIDLIHS